MLTVNLLCVGRIKEPYFKDAIEEYVKRLRPFCKYNMIEIPESRLMDTPSAADIESALEKEGKLLLERSAGLIFPLCIEGRQHSSRELAGMLEMAKQTHSAVSFIIGSSYGLSDRVKKSGECLSMSRMTFPHTLARVMLTEQIYRAFMIVNYTKYHK